MASHDVFEIARRHLDGVRKSGNDNIMAFCPFHYNRNTPALSMSLSSGLWVCFSCKAKGNLATFLREIGVSHAIIEGQYKYVIEEAEQHRPAKPDPLRTPLVDKDPLPEALLGLFDNCPNSLLDEGFDVNVLRYFDVGFDEDHMRITYPLRDLKGNLVGISGRTVTDDSARYKIYSSEYLKWNLPLRETKKELLLWNAHRVYPNVFNQPDAAVILVEGFKACMWLSQMGVTNVIALMGSHMSEPQQWILERLGATVYVMMDNDNPGLRAREFIASRLRQSLTVKVVEYEAQKAQPSDLSQEEVLDAINSAVEAHLWAMRRP